MVDIHFHIEKKHLYVLGLFILVLVGCGLIYSYNSNPANPSTMGHTSNEMTYIAGTIPTSALAGNNASAGKINASVLEGKIASSVTGIGVGNIDNSQIQGTIVNACTGANQSIKTINADGTVTCEIDDNNYIANGTWRGKCTTISSYYEYGKIWILRGCDISSLIEPAICVGKSCSCNSGYTSQYVSETINWDKFKDYTCVKN